VIATRRQHLAKVNICTAGVSATTPRALTRRPTENSPCTGDRLWYGARYSESVMHTTFNDRWRRHDGFGLWAVAVLIVVAILVGYVTARF
jgi:hypothetical protein